jgi:hypothetical protein
MSYYIDSPIGELYFISPNKISVLLCQNQQTIRRRNITFVDENSFSKFSDYYKWIYMNIVKRNQNYYFLIYLENYTYIVLNIFYNSNNFIDYYYR